MRFAQVTCIFALASLAACGPSRNSGDDNGTPDAMAECLPEGSHRCQGSTYQTCTGGQWQTAVDCPQLCSDALGCVQCTPGQTFCKDGNVWVCDEAGNPGSEVAQCSGATTCVGGACVDACADAAASKSYIGCEYWAVDLDNAIEVMCNLALNGECTALLQVNGSCSGYNVPGLVPMTLPACLRTQGNTTYTAGRCDPPDGGCPNNYQCNQTAPMCVLDAQHSPFAIVVSNPHAKDVNVTVTGAGGQTIMKTVTAGQVEAIQPQLNNAIPDQSLSGTELAKRAYKVTSELPIVAYQFNPLDNVNVFSNDGSLLIPRSAFDTDYYAMSWPTLDRRTLTPNKDRYYGYVAIVAAADNTQISVTPKATVRASATQQTIAANATVTFTLDAFDVLQLEADADGDLTGTHIVSTNGTPIGVFGGHMAAAFGETTAPNATHTSGPCCADHLEEMMFPSSTWGKGFAIARSEKRTNESDVLRILAQKPGTTVTFTPAPASGTCGTLGPGEFCQVKIQGDTEIVASEPVLVGHYLQSSMWRNNPFFGVPTYIGTGDPSMAIAVPSEQFRKDYTILVPAQYAKNYVSIAAPATGGVNVDGQPVTLTTFPGGGTYRAARVMLSAGQHTITCADGCGITVYGYSDAVSYMFAGGLDLKPIVIL
jgi:hypothetical protein